MVMTIEAWSNHLILAGGGHSHAIALRTWAMQPRQRPNALITLVNRHSTALYSGMIPGIVSGTYKQEQAEIDLRQLCLQADVCFIQAEIISLDINNKQLHLAERQALQFDFLSLDVGGITAEPNQEKRNGICVKPLEPFLHFCNKTAQALPNRETTSTTHERPIGLIGSGLTAVELAFALRARGMQPWIQTNAGGLDVGSARTNLMLEKQLRRTSINIFSESLPSLDPLIFCSGSQGPQWLVASGLPCNAQGRVITDETLAVTEHPYLFASGDCGIVSDSPRPPSGVWAVRAAPVLAANLKRALTGRRLLRWKPQQHALQLIGDGGTAPDLKPRAFGIWAGVAIGPNRLLWHCKQYIDRRFISSFSRLKASMHRPKQLSQININIHNSPPPCRGCAAKVGSIVLHSALNQLDEKPPEIQPLFWSSNDDAAIVTCFEDEILLQSVDGFPSIVSDPWLNGRLSTLHACSDLWACGAKIKSAQAIVTLPRTDPNLQAKILLQITAGIRSVLDPLEASLLGGHTLESRNECEKGALDSVGSVLLTVNGTTNSKRLWRKGPLTSGETLILTRPIGTGVLFAASMALGARPSWIDHALTVMQQSQAPLVRLLARHGCRACTDITGFGLLGHLGEMLTATSSSRKITSSNTHVVLDAETLYSLALPGALQLLRTGHFSTLAPANSESLQLLEKNVSIKGQADKSLLQLLIDPQTCGPLLASVPAETTAAVLRDMYDIGFTQAAIIGHTK